MIKINWDDQKCAAPRDCRKCIDACPQGVFATYPRNGRRPGKEPSNWAITPARLNLCTGCNLCEEVCPVTAIAVSVDT